MITCPICEKQYKKIDSQHLKKHGLTLAQYKEQYGEDAPFGYSKELLEMKSGETHHLYGKNRSNKDKVNISNGLKLMWETWEPTEKQKEHAKEMAYKDGIHVNLGKTHIRSEEYCQNISIALKEYYSEKPRSEEHSKAISDSKIGIPLSIEHRIAISIGLQQRLADMGGNIDLLKFPNYAKQVRQLTEKNYSEFKHIINPNNLTRGIKEYHLDHIVPVIKCFALEITVEEAASIKNLQILWYKDNLQKGYKFDIADNSELLIKLKNNLFTLLENKL